MNSISLFDVPLETLPPVLRFTILFWVFVLGTNIGSFLNVVIARVPEGLSVVQPRSRCPKCEKLIVWHDNIPILSWLVLKAKCRNCSLPISARYPFIELLIGLFALAICARFGLTFVSLELFVFTTICVAIAMIDLDHFLIPISLLVGLALFEVACGGVGYFLGESGPAWVESAVRSRGSAGLIERGLGGLLGFGILALVIVITTPYFRARGRIGPDETAMGWGDPMLLGGIGLAVGWMAVPMVLMLSTIQGSIIGVLLIAFSKDSKDEAEQTEGDDSNALGSKGAAENDAAHDDEEEEWTPPANALPFGPFLVLGALEVLFFGPKLMEMIQKIYGPIFQ